MNESRWSWRLVVFGLAVTAFFLLAVGISTLELSPGKPIAPGLGLGPGLGLAPRLELPLLEILFAALMVLYWPFLILAILYFVFSPDTRKRVLRNVAYLTLLYSVAYLLGRIRLRVSPGEGSPSGPASPAVSIGVVAEASALGDPPDWTVFLLSLVLVGAVMVSIWLVVRQSGRPAGIMENLAEEAREALDELGRGADLRDTVMRCYHEMCQVLRRHQGIVRHQTMTPREFEANLREIGLPTGHIQRLTGLFERVRYGQWVPGQQDEQEAVDCLSMIVHTYADGP